MAGLACRSPLLDLEPQPGGPRLALASVSAPAVAPKLKRLRDPGPGEADGPGLRRAAMESHRVWLEQAFRQEAARRGLSLEEGAPLRLELHLKAVGELPGRMAAWGFALSVATGVAPGLILHNEKLVVGLLGFELVEEGLFWFGGSALLSSVFAPVVLEARLGEGPPHPPLWHETYYVLRAPAKPGEGSARREARIHDSLRKALDKLFADLEAIPGFPRDPALH